MPPDSGVMRTAVKRFALVSAVLALILGAALLIPSTRARLWSVFTRIRGRQTVESVLADVGSAARTRLATSGAAPFTPGSKLTLVALKQEKMLYVFTAVDAQPPTLIKSYPILAASGGPGPKTTQGDNQVPEGLYRVESLNPNSAFHLALRLDYPNAEDRRIAKEEGRDPATLGGDIMIHGTDISFGCLAMGNDAAEDLFVLAALVGAERVRILISPTDFRSGPLPAEVPGGPEWLQALYARLQQELAQFPAAP